MKLELKHLAAYFPYKLKVKVPSGIRVIKGLNQTEAGSFGVHYWRDGREHFAWSIDCKPILRPLSDLTKPCLEGGKVPLMELCKIAYDNHKNFRQRGNVIEILSGEYALYNFYWQKNGFVTIHISDKMARVIPNQIDLFSYLFENHFDIYNLIQNGLAIDINTIKEEI